MTDVWLEEAVPALMQQRLDAAETRLAVFESKINDPVERIKRDLVKMKVYSSSFVKVPRDYYENPYRNDPLY